MTARKAKPRYSFLRPESRTAVKVRNRLVRPVYFVVVFHKPGYTGYLSRKGKLVKSQTSAQRFPTTAGAVAKAKTVLKLHPVLRTYRVDVTLAY